MASSFFSSTRTRATALTIAFGVLAGSTVLTAGPAFAEPTESTAPVETGTPTETTAPVETTSSTSDESATPEVTEDAATPATGQATKPSFTPDEKITYVLTGLEPSTPLSSITVTLPGGSTVAVSPTDATAWDVDADGNYAGELIYSTLFPVGAYSVSVTQSFTDESAEPVQNVVEFGFNVAEAATPEPTETVAPTPTATPSPTETPAPTVATPIAYANASSFLPTDDIAYTAQNFTPGLALDITVVYPDGSSVTVDPTDDSVVQEDGSYPGVLINQSGAPLPLGEYTVTLSQSSGLSATFTFLIANATPGDGTPAPTSTAGAGGTGSKTPTLATTGAEDVFGAAGIGLLALATGAGVLVSRRLAAKKG